MSKANYPMNEQGQCREMIVFPREEPVIENLNSYYLDVSKLLEHYQGQLNSGTIHFASAFAEGAIFFDKDGLLDGVYENREEKLLGKEAVARFIHVTGGDNYTIAVFKIQADELYFWTSLLGATRVYEGLSTEFTDLEGLIRKMTSERLSGYIEISLNQSPEEGLIFFRNGHVVGAASSRENGRLDRSGKSKDWIIQAAKDMGGVFHVSKISHAKPEAEKEASEVPREKIFKAMEELLVELETHIHHKKSTKRDFGILLRKQCIDLAETYPFLDPFADEFAYNDQKIRFKGGASEERVAEGLLTAMKKLAEETGLQTEFRKSLDEWVKKYDINLIAPGVKL
jgi:hypothetical protein